MKQITIDFKNAFDYSKKEKSKAVALAMYVWFVLWMIRSILDHKCMRANCWRLLWM